MILGLDAEFTIQISSRAEHDAGLRFHDGCDRTAFTAESTLAVVRRLESGDLAFTRHPAKSRQRHGNEGGECGPMVLTAHGALAVRHHLKWPIEVVTHAATETRTVNHGDI